MVIFFYKRPCHDCRSSWLLLYYCKPEYLAMPELVLKVLGEEGTEACYEELISGEADTQAEKYFPPDDSRNTFRDSRLPLIFSWLVYPWG